MPWRVSSFRSRAGFSARMTTSRQPPAWTGATITPPNFPGSSCITAFSYTLKSLERAKKLKEVTLRTLVHKASQKGIIVVAGTKARLSINARLGNSLPVIDHKQGHKHVGRVERKRAQSTGYAKDARIFKSRRRATWLDTYRQGSSAGSWLPRRTDSEITGIQRPAFQQTHSRGCQWHKPRERAPPERAGR